MKLSVASTSILALLATIIGSFVPSTMATDDSITRTLLESTFTFDGPAPVTALTDSEIFYLEDVFQSAFNVISGGDAGKGTIRSSIMTDYTIMNEVDLRRGLRKKGDKDSSSDRELFKTLDVPRFSIFFFTDFSCLLCWDDDEDRMLIGNRKLRVLSEESDLDKFNALVCEMLNDGPIPTFHEVSGCSVKFFEAI